MKLTYVNTVQPINRIIPVAKTCTEPIQNNSSNLVHGYSTGNNINFYGRNIGTMGPFLKSTYDKTREFHETYKYNLSEVSVRDIVQIANNLSQQTKHSRQEVLSAMQQVTQFSNMKSVLTISDVLNEHKISNIGTSTRTNFYGGLYFDKNENCKELKEVFQYDLGLPKTLEYLIEKKGFGSINNNTSKIAIFLDETKVSQLEKLNKTHPELLEKYKKIPDFKFFMISGWDSGITFLDRTKGLSNCTKKLLSDSNKLGLPIEEVIDADLLGRINKLGISPNIIKKTGVPTINCVYSQMAPEQMTKNELFRIIDANARLKTNDLLKQLKYKDKTIDYIDKNLQIYTPEVLSKKLASMHKDILHYANDRGFSPEDILYVEPMKPKSYSVINYSYKKINNIPPEQFTNLYKIYTKEQNIDGKLLVFLEDCTITGDSAKDMVENLKHLPNKNTPSLFAFVCGTNENSRCFPKKYKNDIFIKDYIASVPERRHHLCDRKLEQVVGRPEYNHGLATSLIFPYMAPDNNTQIASNIALLHDPIYKVSMNKQSKTRYSGVKNVTSQVVNIADETKKNIGITPAILYQDIKTIEKQCGISFKEKLYEKIHDWFNLR